ncbi:hypothetical protein PIROE2DRAFT_30473, partial [Piromyces sp. E2]
RSFVLGIRSEDFAQQCCLIEQILLRRVHWTELLNVNNLSKTGSKNELSMMDEKVNGVDHSPSEMHITCLIERFNDMSQWVASEILRTSSIDLRAKLIGKFIRIAQKCYRMNNFCTLNQIIYGLQNSYVERLKRTWEKVNSNEKSVFKKLVEFTNPFSNFRLVREAMDKFTDNENSIGALPFAGIFLSDLVHLIELPTNEKETDLSNDYSLVNFQKFRQIAQLVRKFITFQSPNHMYDYEYIPSIFQKCQFLYILEEDVMKELCEEYE